MAWEVLEIPERAGGGFCGVLWDAALHVRGSATIPDSAITSRIFHERQDAVQWCRETENEWIHSSRRVRRGLAGLEPT